MTTKSDRDNGSDTEAKTREHYSRHRGVGLRIDLGNILSMATTIITMVVGLFVMWSNMRVDKAVTELRINNVEAAQVEMRSSMAKLAENAIQMTITQKQMSNTLEWIAKERNEKIIPR